MIYQSLKEEEEEEGTPYVLEYEEYMFDYRPLLGRLTLGTKSV